MVVEVGFRRQDDDKGGDNKIDDDDGNVDDDDDDDDGDDGDNADGDYGPDDDEDDESDADNIADTRLSVRASCFRAGHVSQLRQTVAGKLLISPLVPAAPKLVKRV